MARARGIYTIEMDGTGDAERHIQKIVKAQHAAGVETGKTTKKLNQMNARAKALKGTFAGMKSGMAGVGVGVVGVTASIMLAVKAAKFLFKVIEDGSRARFLNNMMMDIKGGVAAVEALREGLRGAVDTTTIQGYAKYGLQLGITAEQMKIAGGYALTYSQTMGEELEPTLKRVMAAMASGKAVSFRTLGIDARDGAEAIKEMEKVVKESGSEMNTSMGVHLGQIKANMSNAWSDITEIVMEASVLILKGEEALFEMFSPRIIGVSAELNDTLTESNTAVVRQKEAVEDAKSAFFTYSIERVAQEKDILKALEKTDKALWAQVFAARKFEKVAREQGQDAAWVDYFNRIGLGMDSMAVRATKAYAKVTGLAALFKTLMEADPNALVNKLGQPEDLDDLIEGFDAEGRPTRVDLLDDGKKGPTLKDRRAAQDAAAFKAFEFQKKRDREIAARDSAKSIADAAAVVVAAQKKAGEALAAARSVRAARLDAAYSGVVSAYGDVYGSDEIAGEAAAALAKVDALIKSGITDPAIIEPAIADLNRLTASLTALSETSGQLNRLAEGFNNVGSGIRNMLAGAKTSDGEMFQFDEGFAKVEGIGKALGALSVGADEVVKVNGKLNKFSEGFDATINASKIMTAAFVDDIEIRAGILAGFEVAESLKAFALSDYLAGALHAASAIAYGLVAGGSFSKGGSGGGGGGASSFVPEDLNRSSPSDSEGGGSIIINIGGDLVAGDAATGGWLMDAINNSAETGGHLDPRLSRLN